MDANTESAVETGFDLDGIVRALHTDFHVFPEEALRQAQQHRRRIVPKLTEVLRRAIDDYRAGKRIENNGPFFTLFLLWEFKAREAWPVIKEAMLLPEQGSRAIFGDANDHWSRIIAVLAPDPCATAAEFVQDRSLDGFDRWFAASTYFQLFRDGRIQREEAVERLRSHLRQAVDDRDDYVIVSGLVHCLYEFAAAEAMPDIERAFQEGAVDESIIDLDEVKRGVGQGNTFLQEELKHHPAAELTDVVSELREWASFQPREAVVLDVLPAEAFAPPLKPEEYFHVPPPEPVETIRYDGPHIGRNEPCPCGSGRKFKKCCGSRRNVSDIEL
jgi:hypothetical protein